MRKCRKLSLRLVHISLGDKTVSKIYPENDMGSDEKLIIDLTISIKVQFLLSTISFSTKPRVHSIGYNPMIPKERIKLTKHIHTA